MKPSDLVTSASERQQEMQGLLRTELTDAVNSGLVEGADKSARALKGVDAVKHAAKGGASSAVLAAAARHRAEGPQLREGGTSDDAVSSTSTTHGVDASTLPKEGTSRSPSSGRLGRGIRNAAFYEGTRKALEDTELEGADDLYNKGRVAKKAAHRISYAVNRSGRKVVQTARSARDEIFKKASRNRTGSQAQTSAQAQSRAQAASYGKRTVYETAEKAREAAAAKTAATTVAGTSSSGGAAAIAAGPALLLAFLALVLFLILAGAAGQQSQQAGDGTLNQTESQVASFLMGKGLDELHTAAIMGNMYAESGITPSAVESGGTGIGICQWSYGRANNLRSYAAQQGKNWDDLNVQLDFFWDHDEWSTEWSGSYTITTHQVDGDPAVGERVSGSKSDFLASGDLTEATKSFCYGWERPGIPRINVRLEAAQRYYAALTSPGGFGGGGQDYASAEPWQRAIVDAAYYTPTPGASLCATWVSNVYVNAGLPHPGGNGNSILAGYATSTDWSSIKVGQIISCQASGTPMGQRYGHTAIYVGDGKIRESTTINGSGVVREQTLSDFISYYSRYGWVVYGWPW